MPIKVTILVFAIGGMLFAQPQDQIVTNQTVAEMVRAGVAQDLIIDTISKSECRFLLDPTNLVWLKNAGVADDVVRAMAAKAAGRAGPASPAATTAAAPPAPVQPAYRSPESGPPRPTAAKPAGQNWQLTQFEKAKYLVKAPGQGKATEVEGTLVLDPSAKTLRFVGKNSVSQLEVPYSAITSLVYERAAKPRYAAGLLLAWPLLFTKSKKHFLTVQYQPEAGEGQFAVIRLDKKNFQMCLAAIEAQTGRKVERTEER